MKDKKERSQTILIELSKDGVTTAYTEFYLGREPVDKIRLIKSLIDFVDKTL